MYDLTSWAKGLTVIVYRLTLHPLAQHPGPLIGRITDWYSVYQAWKGDRHLNFLKLHERYGEAAQTQET